MINFVPIDDESNAKDEKYLGFLKAPFGIVGLETAFPLLYTHLVKTGTMSLEQLVNDFTKNPAETFDLPYGVLEEGAIADLALIDLEKEETIDKTTFYSKGKNTPFDGWKVSGIPVMTIFEGKIVYEGEANE